MCRAVCGLLHACERYPSWLMNSELIHTVKSGAWVIIKNNAKTLCIARRHHNYWQIASSRILVDRNINISKLLITANINNWTSPGGAYAINVSNLCQDVGERRGEAEAQSGFWRDAKVAQKRRNTVWYYHSPSFRPMVSYPHCSKQAQWSRNKTCPLTLRVLFLFKTVWRIAFRLPVSIIVN